MTKTFAIMVRVTIVSLLVAASFGCAALKPILRGVNDVARDLCELHYREHPPADQLGSPAEVAKAVCAVQEKLHPFIDLVLSAQRLGVHPGAMPSAHASSAPPSGSAQCVVPLSSGIPSASPSPSAAP